MLYKLRPDRDLQCYFERPSAIAALSDASETQFTVSGCWRQQFDWAVVEWNRDNVFEHPAFRNLPDGDLSGLVLEYNESRVSCMALDSDIYPTVDWPYLRLWVDVDGQEKIFRVPIRAYAAPISGEYQNAGAEFELEGVPQAGDYVGLTWLSEHHTHQVYWDDTRESIIGAIAESINAYSTTMTAVTNGAKITLTLRAGAGQVHSGRNGDRVGVYGHTSPNSTVSWKQWWKYLEGGQSPEIWHVRLPFDSLRDLQDTPVPTSRVRKMRWTYAADLQRGEFRRTEFAVRITDWTVSGTARGYSVAGPGTRRIECDASDVNYSGQWQALSGNFSGGVMMVARETGARAVLEYNHPQEHSIYIGTRLSFDSGRARCVIDGSAVTVDLCRPGEDSLIRLPAGEVGAGFHRIEWEHAGDDGRALYLDFIEAVCATESLPVVESDSNITLATDWDTDHSLAVAPERTAWMLESLGYRGRANHYVGAMWFYELFRKGHRYSQAAITFEGTPVLSTTTKVTLGRLDQPAQTYVEMIHLNLAGDNPVTIAKAFEFEINRGYTSVWAEADGDVLRVYARSMGVDGDQLFLAAEPAEGSFRAIASRFAGGLDGNWRTDLEASPRVNRAVRDWSRAYYAALKKYDIPVAAAFSTELQHGDPDAATGIAQRYPDGRAVLLNTPALQTNFSDVSLKFWTQIYIDMADAQVAAGLVPYLQFGEVQWWYFPNSSGMPFYDAYSRDGFRERFGREMQLIRTNSEDPGWYSEELSFLSDEIGLFTDSIMNTVRAKYPEARFEVLYPPDVNETPLNHAANYPHGAWTPDRLDCMKTESFTYTLTRNLDASLRSMQESRAHGFAGERASHLIGISDPTSSWEKEMMLAKAEGLESVVLFALDQFCLIGYPLHPTLTSGRSLRMG